MKTFNIEELEVNEFCPRVKSVLLKTMEFETDDPKSEPIPFPKMEFETDKTIKSI